MAGLPVLSKDPGFGVSQFMEGARYQHALETELARTISNLQAIEGARVHLALPRQSAFVRDRRAPTASVFVQLKPGRRLESEQVTAIVNLVASSIPELEAQQVTVVDQQGRLLSSPEHDDELAARESRWKLPAAWKSVTPSVSKSCWRRGGTGPRSRASRRGCRGSRQPKKPVNNIALIARSFAASRPPKNQVATVPDRQVCQAL